MVLLQVFYTLADFYRTTVLQIAESKVLKSPTKIVDFSISFSSIKFCFLYFEALLFGAYTFVLVHIQILMSSW